MNVVVVTGLVISLVASFLIGYGRIFRTKGTIHEESKTSGHYNIKEAHHRLVETRMAQAGAVLLAAGFAMQLVGNIFFES
jgi:hypothetical protein